MVFGDCGALAAEFRLLAGAAAVAETHTGVIHGTARQPQPAPSDVPAPVMLERAQDQAQTDAILAALNATRWNRRKAAAVLGVNYGVLRYRMRRLGLRTD